MSDTYEDSSRYLPFSSADLERDMQQKSTHVAKRTEHRCHLCSRKIPIGARYFQMFVGAEYINLKEHTNCLDFEAQPIIQENQPRVKGAFLTTTERKQA